MKKLYLLLFLGISYHSTKAQLFQQDFSTDMATVSNGVSADPNYVADPPSASQFTYLGAPVSGTISVSGGALRTTTTSTSSRWAAVRNASFATIPTAVMVKFDANITVGSSGTSAPKFVFYLGSGLTNSTAMDANASIHSGFGIKYQNSGYYYVNTLSGTNVTTQFAENVNRTFTFVTNNSGAALSYTAPDGTTESVANDTWDLWVNNDKLFNDVAATTAGQDINNFKFGDINGNNGRADFVMDYVTITDLTPALPISFGSFTAMPNASGVVLKWNTLYENNIEAFQVERSGDGRTFMAITSVNSTRQPNGASYAYTDMLPLPGTNCYRIKSVEKDGSTRFSPVIKIAAGKQAAISIAPNPVRDYTMNLQVSSISKGSYTLQLFNAAGQQVLQQILNIEMGSSAQIIQLPKSARSGNYIMVLSNGDDVYRRQVSVQ